MKMKEKFVEYLKSIGLAEPLLTRVETIHAFFDEICPDDIQDIFISERTYQEKRKYESVWLFSMKYVMEAKKFTQDVDNFDILPITGRVEYCNIEKKKYDFDKATQESEALLKVKTDMGLYLNIRASQENCDRLKQIMEKYVLPNLKE